MADWKRRLPEGVEYQGETTNGFTLSVSLPVGDDGLSPLVCPKHDDHRFKVRVVQGGDTSSNCYCAYCGHLATTWDFMPAQMDRALEAASAAAEALVAEKLNEVFADLARQFPRSSSGSGISMSFTPGQPPVRTLPAYEIEPTRRSMTCLQCREVFAVYGLAIYCPHCGQLAPQQRFAELIRIQIDRLGALDGMDTASRRRLDESGVMTATLESTIKDGFTALETYLKNRFEREAANVTKQPSTTTFQRLDDSNDLYVAHVGVDLRQKAGKVIWEQLGHAASIRQVLTHNSGVIDEKFLAREPNWPQALGERIQVGRGDVDSFLDALERFSASVL
ncbi:MAG TPA: hypothetical protein VF990_11415 [Candidatus Dormibacteraeota bacterium]